ncbi:MAG: glycosyltransferase family A protein [Spirochaetales bacterium]
MKIKNKLRYLLNYRIVAKSKYFNAEWYLKQNPDVKNAGVNPVTHYLQNGWKDGRNPSEWFNGNDYLRLNADVKKANINPLLHYEKYGKNENRKSGGGKPIIITRKTKHYNLKEGIIDYGSLPKTEKLPLDSKSSPITLIYGVYYQHNNFKGLIDRLKEYDTFSDEIKKKLKIILVDDCSIYPISLPDNINLNITLLRVLEDKKWNSCGVRNLGVCYADTEKVLCMDIDWVIDENTLKMLQDSKINDNEMIVFDRTILNKEQLKKEYGLIHPNTFAVLKSTFLKNNGYDEDIVGIYGDDIFFRKHISANGIKFIRTGHIMGLIRGFNEHNLSRDLKPLYEYMKNKKEHTKVMLNFPWQFVDKKEYKDNYENILPYID